MASAGIFLLLASASAQNIYSTPPPNRGQKAPTPGYRSKSYSLQPMNHPKKEKVSRFIPLPKNKPSGIKEGGVPPTPFPRGKPVTAWTGMKRNYSSIYQDPRP